MRIKINTLLIPKLKLQTLFVWGLWVICVLATTMPAAQAQNKPKPLTEEQQQFIRDSIERLTKERMKAIKETDTRVEDKVVQEINRKRFQVLAHKWWDMPTDTAQKFIDRGRYSRYEQPMGMFEMLRQPDKLFRRRAEIYSSQNVVVWGWHPYWMGETYRNYDFSLLTHVAFFGYELNPFTGGYRNFEAIHDFRSNDLIQLAQKDSCKVLLTLSCHGPQCSEVFFTSEKIVQRNLMDSLISILDYVGGDGIEINFEEVPKEYKIAFLGFVKELSFALREHNPNFTVAMSIPLQDKEQIYDLGFLQAWVDLFIIAGYNFHLRPSGVSKGPIAPLYDLKSDVRSSFFSYDVVTNLDTILRANMSINSVVLLHDEAYLNQLKDQLNAEIKNAKITAEYEKFNLAKVLEIIKMSGLINSPTVRDILRRTSCVAERSTLSQAPQSVRFFLFSPEWDTISIKELSIYNRLDGVDAEVDSVLEDLNMAIDRFVKAIGSRHSTSLVLGLPYYGAVWQVRGKQEFVDYMPYGQILNLLSSGQARVRYDKFRSSMIAEVYDSLGIYQEIYFDNASTLSKKIDLALNKKLGGIAIWALGYDHGHNELWETLQENFAERMVWDKESDKMERFKIAKSNKIHYTVAYMLKRNSNIIFATLFFITIFMTLGFAFALLDWKVRDVMFYSGAFRIFYLAIFTILVLVVGSYLGLFQNRMIAFLIGILLGGILTWLATMLVIRRHEKLP